MDYRDSNGDDERGMSDVTIGLIAFFAKSGMA